MPKRISLNRVIVVCLRARYGIGHRNRIDDTLGFLVGWYVIVDSAHLVLAMKIQEEDEV